MMVGMTHKAPWLAAARSAMQTEAEAVLAASKRLGDSLLTAVDLIVGNACKVVVTGAKIVDGKVKQISIFSIPSGTMGTMSSEISMSQDIRFHTDR